MNVFCSFRKARVAIENEKNQQKKISGGSRGMTGVTSHLSPKTKLQKTIQFLAVELLLI